MTRWYAVKEQCAGRGRLLFLWWVYKIFHLRGLRWILYPIVGGAVLFSRNGRTASRQYRAVLAKYKQARGVKIPSFSTYRHIYSYAFGLAEKMSALCDEKCRLAFDIHRDENWDCFQKDLAGGVFLISSHLGNVQVLCALPKYFPALPFKKVNALMEIGQNSVFQQFIEARTRNDFFTLYDTQKLGFAEMMTLYEKISAGEMVLMAGDRVSSQNTQNALKAEMLGKKCSLPAGVFQMAQKIGRPTYAVLLLRTSVGKYTLFLKKINTRDSVAEMAQQYLCFVEQHLLTHPDQWYNFFNFFE